MSLVLPGFRFFPTLFIPFLFSCTQAKDAMAKAWIYEASDKVTGAVSQGNRIDPNLSPANFLDLQQDGSYAGYLNHYETGKWLVKEEKLILVNRRKELHELHILRLNKKKLVCTDEARKILYHFSGHPNEFTSPAQNPFSIGNNQWRLKAKHKESDAELNARMKNHFSFWEKYFAWGYQNHLGYLDVRSTAGPLKIYRNGFQLEYYDNLLPEWKAVFYDTADCRIAFENLHYKMYEKEIKWPKTDNRFERFVSAFQQLQSWMDEKMSPYVRR
jgi:hypothetical protein